MFTNKYMFLNKFFMSAFLMALVVLLPFANAKLVDEDAKQAKRKVNSGEVNSQTIAKQQDPTRPPSVIVQQLSEELAIKPEFELTAIFSRNKQQYAVVNGTVLKTGDALDNMIVTQISDTNITLQNTDSGLPDQTIELHAALNIKKQVIK